MTAIVFGTPELGVGLVMGLAYALLGMGVVLIYRTTGVIHFGYGEVGAFGAVVLALLVANAGWSWWLAFPVAVGVGGAVGAAWELTVVRRLFSSPRLVLLVATIGIGQVMFAAQAFMPTPKATGVYPMAIDLSQPIGSFVLRGDHVAVLVAVPMIAGALTWFLKRTFWGLAIRGAASNRDGASLAGVDVRRLSTIVWALSGALASTTFILILPVRGVSLGFNSQAALGAGLLVRALVVGLIGRMESFTVATAGGLCFGVVETALLANMGSARALDMFVFALMLALLLARGAPRSRDSEVAAGDFGLQTNARLEVSTAWLHRVRPWLIGGAAATAIAMPFVFDRAGAQFRLASIAVFALIGISVTVITGWAGQVSLCQFTFVGLGAVVTGGLVARGMDFPWALVYAAAVCAATAAAVGLPALRIRGLFLATATLGFAVASHSWLLDLSVFRDATDSVRVPRGTLGPFDLSDQAVYYFFCVALVAIVGTGVSRLRRGGVGRMIVAVRENENAASSFTVAVARTKLLAFALSGGIAGLAGGLYGGLYFSVRPAAFGPEVSLQVLAMAIIGGLTSVAGAVIGATYLIGVPLLFGGGVAASLMTSGIGVLVLLLFTRGGLLEVAQRLLDRMLLASGSRMTTVIDNVDVDVVRSVPGTAPAVATHARPHHDVETALGEPILACSSLTVRFDGLVALRGVDLSVNRGEVVGLIGTNGAGKSTLLNAIGGHVQVAEGEIVALGHDVTGWLPHERARLGIGRVFQDAALFADLTVRECALVALEAHEPTEFVPSLLGFPPARRAERHKRIVVEELVDLVGLHDYADTKVAALSTGTRRIVELACLLGTGSQLLLLDEPTAGVAQREVEALGGVLENVREQLEATVLLIEHDMPLVMSLSTRVICMTAGEVIAQGTPAEIRADPIVVAAYLGTESRAIDRSDSTRMTRAKRTATT